MEILYQDIKKAIMKKKNYLILSLHLIFKNHIYKIQKNFEDFDKNELVFSNPTKRK